MSAVLLVAILIASPGLAQESVSGRSPRLTRLGDVAVPLSVSPDSRFIAEMGSSGNLVIRTVATGQTLNVTGTVFPQLVMNGAFSPGSDLIAFSWHNDEDHDDLRVVGVDGSGPRLLYRDPAVRSIRVEGWSPDGTHILVTIRYRDASWAVALVPAAGGTPRAIPSFEPGDRELPGDMAFSPDGEWIAYDRPGDEGDARHDLFMTTVNGERHIPLLQDPGDDRVLGWSPSGDGVVFASDRSGSVDVWLQPVSAGAPDGAPRVLSSDIGPMIPLGSGPDGTFYISRVTCDCELLLSELQPEDVAGADASMALGPAVHNTGAYWSPDGERLASIEPTGGVIPPGMGVMRGAWALTIRTADGAVENRWPLPVDVLHQLRPLWSPDGRTILVKGWDRTAYPREVVLGVDVESGRHETLLGSPSVWERQLDWVTWSADGSSLYYTDQTAGGTVGLYRWDIESRSEETLIAAMPPPFYYGLASSPDGGSLAFGLWDTRRGVSTLVTLDLATGEQTELARVSLPESVSSPTWSPNSRHLFYGVGDRLWRVPSSGGEPRQVRVPQPLAYNQAGLGLHPDGKRLAYVRERGRSSEVWALEGLITPP